MFVVKLLTVIGIKESMAICLTLAFGAGCASALMALNLLLLLRDKLLRLLMQALFLGSSSFLFWAGICERFVISSASILAVSAIAAVASNKRQLSYVAAVTANVLGAEDVGGDGGYIAELPLVAGDRSDGAHGQDAGRADHEAFAYARPEEEG